MLRKIRSQIEVLKDRGNGAALTDFVVNKRGRQASRECGFDTPC